MTPSTFFHSAAVLLLAGILIILYSNSQVNHSKYEESLLEILQLIEQDNQINHKILELQGDYKDNYDALVAARDRMRNTLAEITTWNSPTNLSQFPKTGQTLQQVEIEFENKLSFIEVFQKQNAELKVTLNALPDLVKQINQRFNDAPEISPEDKTRLNLLTSLTLSSIFIFNSQLNITNTKLVNTIDSYRQVISGIVSELYLEDINRLFTQVAKFIRLQQSTAFYVTKILSDRISNSAKELHRAIDLDFQESEKRADIFRLWLFFFSLLLLSYLAVIVIKLQLTSKTLKQSIIDLKFHKKAIDEHSIVSITDVKGKILYANSKFCEISQFHLDELIGNNHSIIRSESHGVEFFREMWKTIAQGRKWQGTFCNKAKDGSLYWVDSTIIPRINNSGKPYQYISIRTDITDKKLAEENAKLLARFPSENPDPVLRFNQEGELLYANPASSSILKFWNLDKNLKIPDDWQNIIGHCMTENIQQKHEVKVDDNYYSILFAPVPQEAYINLYARNISDIKSAEKDLNHLATHDPLTNLTNRYAFELLLTESLQKAQDSDVHSVLLYIDLDQFKIVNDTCGHVAGDELLRQVSNIFLSSIRDSDVLARLGGDEFGIILNNCDTRHGEWIAGKILAALNQFRFGWADSSFEIGASIGLVEITPLSDSTVSLLGEADIACYAAKDAGRNRLKIYQQDKAISKRKDEMHWATLIPRSLEENKFILYAQLIKPLNPEQSAQSHYEIIIRLQNEQMELIPPGAFIPAAERYGLMNSIDLWVIQKSFELLGGHNTAFPQSPIHIAINLSGQSIGNTQLIEYIPLLFKKHRIDASHITFEITETCAITNLTHAIQFIKELKSLGCKFALDDFGSGLSSFAYLKNLPVDYLKIDGAFVKDILDDPIDAAMVQSINQIGHVMNIKTIAEFVESELIEKRLVEMQVDFVQGYGIERPRPFKDVLEQAAISHQKANSSQASCWN